MFPMLRVPHFLALLIALVLGSTTPAFASDCPEIDAAVANLNRPDADRDRDEGRMPADVLCFFEVEAGEHVLDLFSGGGYYTEIVAGVVGSDGAVMAHNNKAFLAYVKDQLTERNIEDRLPNVKQLAVEANDLILEPSHFDTILMVLAFHDLYYVTEDDTWPAIEVPRILSALYDGLKPGGVVGIVDHVGNAMTPRGSVDEIRTAVNAVHRIDPAIIKADMEAAGFVLEAESNLLRNPEDDLDKPMWAEGIRGKTDRVVYRFRKPAN